MNIYLLIVIIILTLILGFVIRLWFGFRYLRSYSTNELKKFLPSEYTLREKKLTTKDGYHITLFNVRHDLNFNENLTPVLMDHMMGASAAIWLVLGENNSPGLILAKMGGSVYSFGHETLDTKSEEYWRISFQDLKYDTEAYMSYIFGLTQKKINCVAMSQSATAMLAALADPDRDVSDSIVEKLDTFYCLAPVVFTVKLLLSL